MIEFDTHLVLPWISHSITASTWARRPGGIAKPSLRAVPRFMERQNLVGCSTGLGRVTALAPTAIALTARMRPAVMPLAVRRRVVISL